ncbi:MAG: hypothetical protein BGO99_13750 [Nitrosospira sp. 56-18]|nr:hypothetical protein [Nitrosospira sp.]OJY12434.1 MAG: hypothetical protein BGO99_13750 [Nitrosospira sp. 56-18]
MSDCNSIWSALSTVIIGGAAVGVSVLQWKINQQKLKLDLYDRRIHIYEVVKKIIQKGADGLSLTGDELSDFESSASQAEFLFDTDIPTYIYEIHRRGVNLRLLLNNEEIFARGNAPPDYDLQIHVAEMLDEQLWFSNQVDIAREKFRKYLSLRG